MSSVSTAYRRGYAKMASLVANQSPYNGVPSLGNLKQMFQNAQINGQQFSPPNFNPVGTGLWNWKLPGNKGPGSFGGRSFGNRFPRSAILM